MSGDTHPTPLTTALQANEFAREIMRTERPAETFESLVADLDSSRVLEESLRAFFDSDDFPTSFRSWWKSNAAELISGKRHE